MMIMKTDDKFMMYSTNMLIPAPSEDWDNLSLQNVSEFIADYKASHPSHCDENLKSHMTIMAELKFHLLQQVHTKRSYLMKSIHWFNPNVWKFIIMLFYYNAFSLGIVDSLD